MKTTRTVYNHLATRLIIRARLLNSRRKYYQDAIEVKKAPARLCKIENLIEHAHFLTATNGNNDVILNVEFYECADQRNRIEIRYNEYGPAGDRYPGKAYVYEQSKTGHFLLTRWTENGTLTVPDSAIVTTPNVIEGKLDEMFLIFKDSYLTKQPA